MRRALVLVLTTAAVTTLPAAPQMMPAQEDTVKAHEREIQERLKNHNGIDVGEPKVYDDALLQQMLSAAEARLAAIQVLDQSGITAKIGALSGADQRTTSFALTVQTPPLPEVSTVQKGASESVVTKETATSTTTDTTAGAATTDVTTKSPQTTAPTATPAPPATTLPSNFSVSASDLLNEQMQLTFEIANLRLLLDGALSDRLFTDKDKLHRLKPRHTIGIPIVIDPKSVYKNAVAVVEMEIVRKSTLAQEAEISLTALLPREKTYNVAAIRESNTNIGGGVITQVVGIGGGFLKARKTYYIVQDQDTLAQTFQPRTPHTLGVAWHFRPVLGHEYVRPRQTQTFVQLAFPSLFGQPDFAAVRVRSYWRRYDRKHGVVKEMINGSLSEKLIKGELAEWNVPTFDTTIPTLQFNHTNLEDLGAGQMLVTVPTRIMSGTALRIGPTILKEGAAGVVFSQTGVRFAATLSDVATKQVALIGRDGQETPLVISRQETTEKAFPAPSIQRATAVPLDERTSLVEVQLAAPRDTVKPEQVLVIGGKVFGYSDAPIVRNAQSFAAVVPTALIQANPSVQVTALFAPAAYRASRIIEGVTSRSRTERLVLLAESGGNIKLLLYGSRLSGAKILVPGGATLTEVAGTHPDDAESFRLVTVKSDALKGLKQLVLQRNQERPIFISLPTSEAPKKPEPKPRERIVVNGDAAVFDSDGLADLTGVTVDNKALTATVATDKQSVTVSGLRAAGATTAAGTVTLDFAFGETKVPVKLEVVNARAGTAAK